MLEKLTVRRSWNKVSVEIAKAKLDLAYLDNHLNVNPYSKEFYVMDCKKLTGIINAMLSNKRAIMDLMDKIVQIYPRNEADTKIEAINNEIKFLENAIDHCKKQLDSKQEIYEPDELVRRVKLKLRYDGGTDPVPVTERQRTPKCKEYNEMEKAVTTFHIFASDIDEYAFASSLVIP